VAVTSLRAVSRPLKWSRGADLLTFTVVEGILKRGVQYLNTVGSKVGRQRVAPISSLDRRIWASTILAVIFAVPIAAFAQGTKKLADTFEERYPTEQVPSQPSSEQAPSQPSSEQAPTQPAFQQAPTPAPIGQAPLQRPALRGKAQREAPPNRRQEPALPKNIANTTTRTRVIRAKRSLSLVEFAFAAAPSANAWLRPEWVVVRWGGGDCKIWHNDTNAPAGYGWSVVAFANNFVEAFWKMTRLYRRGVCVG
jgi:hypothetical protein